MEGSPLAINRARGVPRRLAVVEHAPRLQPNRGLMAPLNGAHLALPPFRPEIRLVSQYKLDHTGSLPPQAMADITLEEMHAGRVATWFTANFPLKYLNDTLGHKAGDAYLAGLAERLHQVAREVGALRESEPVVVRTGPNFSVYIPEGIDREVVQAAFSRACREEEFEFSFESRDPSSGKVVTETWGIHLTPNENFILFDPSLGLLTGKEILTAAVENVHYLNRGSAGRRVQGTFWVMPDYIRHFGFDERVVGYHELGYDKVEPLPEVEQFQKNTIAAIEKKQRGDKEPLTIVFFDGNKSGAYRAWGFIGEILLSALMEIHYADVAKKVFPEGVTVHRFGPGSEEFFIEGNVDTATMQKLIRDFMAELGQPFKIRMEVSELEATNLGRRFLERNKHLAYEYTYADGTKTMMVDVDVNDPRGENGEYEGATITAAVREIELYPELSPAEIFQENLSAVQTAGEKAKELNPDRGNFIVTSETTSIFVVQPE